MFVVTNNKFTSHFQKWAETHKDIKVRVINDGTNTPEERLGSIGDINYVWKQEKELENQKKALDDLKNKRKH